MTYNTNITYNTDITLIATYSQGAYVIPWDFYGEREPPTLVC